MFISLMLSINMYIFQEVYTFYNSFTMYASIHVNKLVNNTCCLLEKQIQ